jgi:RNA polymerase sigma-70 factor (ECF subfamily)
MGLIRLIGGRWIYAPVGQIIMRPIRDRRCRYTHPPIPCKIFMGGRLSGNFYGRGLYDLMGAPMKPQESPHEAALIRRAQEGDMDAFESLVRNYQGVIYALCRRLVGVHQAADDLAQEAFIKAYFSLSRFDTARPFYPWLRRIAANGAFNYLKSRKREFRLDESVAADPPKAFSAESSRPEEKAVRAEFEERFNRALESLPDDQRSVFVLRHFEDMSYREISRALGLPNGTVMSRLNRARRRLRTLLADFLPERA